MPVRVLVIAVALAIIFEGILPFISPRLCRQGLLPVLRLSDRTLRLIGLGALVVGVALLYAARFTG